jgi:DNA-binding NarL/FixJ family response regulator
MRILLARMSNMLTSIITAALQQSPDADIVIAGVVNERANLARRIRATQAEAVIMQVAEPGDFELFRPLLQSYPTLKVIGITGDGQRGFVHELHPGSTQLRELSAATLRAALQSSPVRSTADGNG